MREIIKDDLKRLQAMPLGVKIDWAKGKIREYVDAVGGPDRVYVVFAGDKNSIALLHLVRSMYPNVRAVFYDSGLDYKETLDIVNKTPNIQMLTPKIKYHQIWKKYGLPVVAKEHSRFIADIRESSDPELVTRRLNYGKAGSLPKKYLHFTDKTFFPQKVSDRCCHYFKREIIENHFFQDGKYPILSVRADESISNLNSWIKYSCNMLNSKSKKSRPLSIWLEDDVDLYIKNRNLTTLKINREKVTKIGCSVCPFESTKPVNDKGQNKFEFLKEYDPVLYKKLKQYGLMEVLMNMDVEINNDPEYMKELNRVRKEVAKWYEKVEKDIKKYGQKSKYYKYHKYFE